MKRVIKKYIIKVICNLNIPKIIHKVFLKKTITILTYHAIIDEQLPVRDWCFLESKAFEKQMKYLKKNFKLVSLSKAIKLIDSGNIKEPTAVITFDDGFQNNFTVAFPILRKLAIPATIFLSTKFVDTNETIWFCRINRAIAKTKKNILKWKHFNINISEEKDMSSVKIQNKLKELTHQELLDETKKIILELGEDPNALIGINEPYSMLNNDAVTKMVSSDLIEFGAHTHSHAILGKITNSEKKIEINKSIHDVQQITTHPCELFAYPNGGPLDFNRKCIEILESSGIRAAVTMISGPNGNNAQLMKLKRNGIAGDIGMHEFEVKVHQFDWLLKKILKIVKF